MSSARSSTGAAVWRENRRAFLARYAPGADPAAFADAWRRRYSPAMEEIRSGRRPFARLDVLHRENLEAVLPEFGIDPASVPLAALLTANRLLVALGYEPALAAEIGRFLGAIAWAAPGFLGFAVLRSFLAASHSRTVMIALILCIPMNAGLNWILVFGHLGAPALGIAGSGCATAVIQWLMFTGLGSYALTGRTTKASRSGSSANLKPAWSSSIKWCFPTPGFHLAA